MKTAERSTELTDVFFIIQVLILGIGLLTACAIQQPTPTPTTPPTHAPTQTATATKTATATATATPTHTLTPTYTPTATFTPTPTSTNTPSPTAMPTETLSPVSDPTKGTVRGSLATGNTLLALIPEINGVFEFRVSSNTPQTRTDSQGQFEFVNVEPGYYAIVGPLSDGSFQTYNAPRNVPIMELAFGLLWAFEVRADETVNLGRLSTP